ncbi:YHS domain-containing protein [Exilibacterium tricleocarpae]|uniref:YHS domain-containing protein n=1 Tax=Exilibacterium tricleocarpae TaxID=2591008 RepID=A0A545U6P4_9GAMM|nr:YHS domain-containing (seleno)protein [Exilibacterium tricleocarpae]TQV85142.1 YHS domain-containing protein [Exilibacterium tricleocarpae]
MFKQKIITLIGALLMSGAAMAADPEVYSHKKHGAIKGTDPVAYFSLQPGQDAVSGSDQFTYEWNGATWKFASAENREKFIANPEQYAPQYGGYCAFAVSHNFTKPTDPDAWRIVDNKLYLNLSKRVQKKWVKDIPGNIAKADSNWPGVLNN